MGNLFIVVYVFGRIAAAVGPLPYGMETCRREGLGIVEQIEVDGWAKSLRSDMVKTMALRDVDGNLFRGPGDIMNFCEWHARNPAAKQE